MTKQPRWQKLVGSLGRGVLVFAAWPNRPSHLVLVAATIFLANSALEPNSVWSREPVAVASTNGDSGDELVWRSKRVCGLNCAYFVLRAHGKDPDYAEMQRRLLKEEFTSLRDIKQAAAEYGVQLRLARMTPEQLRNVDKPAVAHFDLVDIKGGAQGHFVIVTQTDDNTVQFIDGTTVLTRSLSWREFQRNWSGYVAHRTSTEDWPGWPVLALVGGVISGLIVDRILLWRRNALSKNTTNDCSGEHDERLEIDPERRSALPAPQSD
jgi:peptidase C39-like protein